MSKKITLRFVTPEHAIFPGIYKITLGGKFYIGRANIPAERIKNHECALNRAISIYERRNFEDIKPSLYKEYFSYRRWIKCLVENPNITEGTVEIIQRAIHPISLYYMEGHHLNQIRNHPDSLNAVFTCARPNPNDYHFCDAKIENGRVILFNQVTGNAVYATSAAKDLPDFKAKMNANASPASYRTYIGSLMNRDYKEDAPYLTTEQKSERLRRISNYIRGL